MTITNRYCAKMMYLGKGYYGYQKQKKGQTIQGSIEDAMKVVFKEVVEIVGCGRTDTGVNAKEYYFHFDSEFADPQSRLYSLNGILGDKIVLNGIKRVDKDFHARYDATERGYEYFIHTSKNPFLKDSSYYLTLGTRKLNKEKLQEAASLLLGKRDFFTFCKTHSDVSNTFCHITKSEWDFEGEQMRYVIHGNRFLRGMVRMIVGAMLNIGLGKMNIQELYSAMERIERLQNSWSVPAHSLYLYKVNYPKGSVLDL